VDNNRKRLCQKSCTLCSYDDVAPGEGPAGVAAVDRSSFSNMRANCFSHGADVRSWRFTFEAIAHCDAVLLQCGAQKFGTPLAHRTSRRQILPSSSTDTRQHLCMMVRARLDHCLRATVRRSRCISQLPKFCTISWPNVNKPKHSGATWSNIGNRILF